jgi:hypothetical protein
MQRRVVVHIARPGDENTIGTSLAGSSLVLFAGGGATWSVEAVIKSALGVAAVRDGGGTTLRRDAERVAWTLRI